MSYLDGGFGQVQLGRQLASPRTTHVVFPQELSLETRHLLPREGRTVPAEEESVKVAHSHLTPDTLRLLLPFCLYKEKLIFSFSYPNQLPVISHFHHYFCSSTISLPYSLPSRIPFAPILALSWTNLDYF